MKNNKWSLEEMTLLIKSIANNIENGKVNFDDVYSEVSLKISRPKGGIKAQLQRLVLVSRREVENGRLNESNLSRCEIYANLLDEHGIFCESGEWTERPKRDDEEREVVLGGTTDKNIFYFGGNCGFRKMQKEPSKRCPKAQRENLVDHKDGTISYSIGNTHYSRVVGKA